MRHLPLLRALLVGVAVVSAATAAAAEKPTDFAFGVPLTLDVESAFYRAALPAAFYTGSSRADQGDLRVFNGDDAVVPFARLDAPAAMHEQKPPATLAFFPLRVDQEGADLSGFSLTINRTVGRNTSVTMTTRDGAPVEGQRLAGYLVDASNVREPITALVLVWTPKPGGMNARIRVETSGDLIQWRTLVSGAPLLDLEYEGRHLLRDRVELQQAPAKYLRISWLPAQAPLQFDGVHAVFGDRVPETLAPFSGAKRSAPRSQSRRTNTC